ncbi:hypothetical protein GTW20_21725 [Nocardiopsis alba]|uniref:Uncharacterized protein n=1 Tax=Nocardiopsis alba TaxID=53437 RepID=A0A7K2IXU6_9ACTN|nr:hypothetical protein [Nocardiopsis alba]MYR34801.1 hypothetical protein [Nocardiopsis alba]
MPSITAAGRTTPGKGWQTHSDYAIYIDIDTSGHFSSTSDVPIYTISLGGDNGMWDSNGAQCVYRATHDGFRVYLRSNFRDTKLDVASAQDNNWFINWHGVQQF